MSYQCSDDIMQTRSQSRSHLTSTSSNPEIISSDLGDSATTERAASGNTHFSSRVISAAKGQSDGKWRKPVQKGKPLLSNWFTKSNNLAPDAPLPRNWLEDLGFVEAAGCNQAGCKLCKKDFEAKFDNIKKHEASASLWVP